MSDAYRPEDLLARIPDYLERVSSLKSRDVDSLADAARAAGLDPFDGRRGLSPDHIHQRLQLPIEGETDPTFERRLRTAVTRRLGKPSGTDKHWDVGLHEATVLVRASVSVILHPAYSLEELRAAALEWLDGAEWSAWLDEQGYARSEGAGPTLSRASVHERDDRRSVTLFLEAGARVRDSKPADDDESFALTLGYLGDALGESVTSGVWVRGRRSFSIRRMRSHTRSVAFTEPPERR